MVPPDFATFFATMAGAGATLFGLIFLAVSMKPESTLTANAPVMRQVQVASAYTALLNPLVISLIALVPHNRIDQVTLIMSSVGLINTLVMSLSLVYLYGIARAWDLIGARQFHIQEVFLPLTQKKHKKSPPAPNSPERVADTPKDQD